MSKSIFKRCSLRNNNGSIIIYYYHISICRYPTGISIDNEKEWDKKNNYIKTLVEDYDVKSKKLDKLIKWVNNIIESKFKEEDVVLTGDELKKLLDKIYQVNQIVKSQKLVEHYNNFYEVKKRTFKNKPQSLKDYTSLKSLLVEFELFYNKKLLIRNFNDFVLEELIEFMKIKHPKEMEINGEIYKFKTEGGMVNDTIRKRLDCLNEFNNYLIKLEILPNNDFIRNKRKEFKPNNKNKISLTIKEVQDLYKKDFKKKFLNETKDLFVFICFTGLRWSDLEQFDYRFIRMDGDEWIYEFSPIKTEDSSSVECFIPLCEIVKEILKKYDLKLKKIIKTNQSFNENLKIVCKESGLFNEITRIKNKETQTYMFKHETITGHKGRDTFITNLIENTPINEIMKYTGHTKVSTLMKYVDKSRNVNSNYVKIFDI